jgi:hydroxyethylthiazole kinase-like uncharacterized protein yjeF
MTAPTTAGPRRILPGDAAWPLHDVSASRAIETTALACHAPHELMLRAGRAVARLALALAPHARQIWVACGPGNNGGDGLVAATLLRQAGVPVHVTLLADAEQLPEDARRAWQDACQAGVPMGPLRADAVVDLAIDALLGLGASRAPQGVIAEAIARLGALGADILAVDLPSGLSADTGQLLGAQAVVASHTLSLLTLKPGLFTGAGRDHAGQIWLDPLGIDPPGQATARLTGAEVLELLPPRRHASHKGSFGDVLVVGGAPGMTGAALLCGRAALAAGAGRVFVSMLDADGPHCDTLQPELMLRREAWRGDAELPARSTVVCGCGGGAAVRDALPALLSRSARLVLDADALNALAADPSLRSLLDARAARGLATVLTPHPLEAARLLGGDARRVQARRLHAADELARRHGCVVLLKGSGSIVASSDDLPALNPTGNGLLAGGGTGDVLAGWVGAFWAQAAAAGVRQAGRRAAEAAAWLHGHAADRWREGAPGSLALRAGELNERMRDAASRRRPVQHP